MRDFTTSDGALVRVGEKGGWVESENNLSHAGNCWVCDNAQVCGNALVCGNAWVYGNAQVYGNAWVYGNALVYGNAQVCGNAWVCDNAQVYGNAWVCEPWHILVIGPIGSRDDYTTFFRGKDGKIYVKCGCFSGDIKEFTAKVKETHGNNHHGKMYKLAIEMAKEQMRGGTDA
ncbi:hypothetical protein WGC32_14970 [Zongyangia sp. HA2173]|uniref:hypothetical protein n=1 Tax=Zongyangia sp. HA2173 TaxID=3133035 RepID=UPI00315FFBDE